MSVLIVVAHPDDEVLGAGGTIYTLARKNIEVNVCVMSAKAQARTFRPTDLWTVLESEKEYLEIFLILN